GTNNDLKAYDLSWTLHLVGDLHQPLHCTTRIHNGQSDNGGNLTKVKPKTSSQPLHTYWDDLLGTGEDVSKVIKSAKKLPAADAMKALDLNVSHWVDEGVQLAKTRVYGPPIGKGTGPFKLTDGYKKNAKLIAQEQVALAGERLANLLNAELK
ncbi:MAG: S1/P1 nuclease, partial [Limisphaerales bacterium]